MTKNIKKIVILGAGFGGLRTALDLSKKNGQEFEITLIDKRDYQLFTSNLYEVASSEEELTSVSQMKKSITLPIKEVLGNSKVNFIQGEVKQINFQEKKLVFATKQIQYDFLVISHGSESDFFGIKGAKENSLVLKSLPDALRIRNKIEYEVDSHKYDLNKQVVRVVVAGGGYTGLEFAAEAKGLLDLLSLKYGYPREKLEIEVIEANNKLVAGFDERLSNDAYTRLKDLGINVRISARISEVDNHFVYLMSGEKVAYDCLVWTTGVKGLAMDLNNGIKTDSRGKIPVNEFLQSTERHEVFVIGDAASIVDAQKKPVPPTAQDAIFEGKFLAKVIPYVVKNQHPPFSFISKKHGFVVALGGKWAIVSYNGLYLKGFLAWIIGQFAHIRYYISVVGIWKGIKYSLFDIKMYSRND